MRMVLTGLATIAVGSLRIWRKRVPYVALCTTAVLFGWLAIRLWMTYLPAQADDVVEPRQQMSVKPSRPSSVPRATYRDWKNGSAERPRRCSRPLSQSEIHLRSHRRWGDTRRITPPG